MNIKLDENLPSRLVSVLRGFGHDVQSTRGCVKQREERMAKSEKRPFMAYFSQKQFHPGSLHNN